MDSQQPNPAVSLLPWAILGGLFLYLQGKRRPVRHNLDAFTDASGKVHPIRGTEGYRASKAGEKTGRVLYELTTKERERPEKVTIASDEEIKAYVKKGQQHKPWGLEKRDRALRALRLTRDYARGKGQGRVDRARGSDYSEERFNEAANLGYHEGYTSYESDRRGWDQATRERFDKLYRNK